MALQTGFEEAFSRFVQQHFGRAVRYCTRMLGNLGDGEEVAQLAFVKLFEKRRDVENEDDSLAYMYRVLRNACVDHIRARKKKSNLEDPDFAPSIDRNLGAAEADEIRQMLFEAVQTLDDAQREAVLLRFYEGLSLAEVARATEKTVGSVAMLLSRAKTKLKEQLGRLPEFSELTSSREDEP